MFLSLKRIRVWGTGLLVLSWFVYLHTTMIPGIFDRVGRVKGSDYVQFYVMGSLVLNGRSDALYDAAAHLSEGRRRIQSDLRLYASHPNYGPQVGLAFAPLACLPYEQSLTLFLLLTGLCYAASVWIIWIHCPSLRQHGSTVALLAGASPLFFALLRYGQASAFALLIWSLFLAALHRQYSFLAGLAIGCLIYKPQLAIVIGIAVLAARQWRVIGGAITMVTAQLTVGWLVAGSSAMLQYLHTIWELMWNPQLVEIYSSEVHSMRGFFQLLLPSKSLITICYAVGFIAVIAMAIRCWSERTSVPTRVAQVLILTILASPHLLTYDLVLLTLPLLVVGDWIVCHPTHRFSVSLTVLVATAFFAPFSSQLARLVPVQCSVPVFAAMSWLINRTIPDEC